MKTFITYLELLFWINKEKFKILQKNNNKKKSQELFLLYFFNKFSFLLVVRAEFILARVQT